MGTEIVTSDIIEWAENYDGPPFHAVLADPPYGIAFMGKEWDDMDPREYEDWCANWARALTPHLLPGALLLLYGGTRSYHRMVCGLEDAGLEPIDTLMWLHGQGFPKGADISQMADKAAGAEREVIGVRVTGDGHVQNRVDAVTRTGTFQQANQGVDMQTAPATELAAAWDGYKTPALKPAWEPISLQRAPRNGMSYLELAEKHGSGCINVDGTRVGLADTRNVSTGMLGIMNDDGWEPRPIIAGSASGRYPANVLLSHLEGCEPVGQRKITNTGKAVRRNAHDGGYSASSYQIPAPAGEDQTHQDPDGTETVQAWKCEPGCPVAELDDQSGQTLSKGGWRGSGGRDKGWGMGDGDRDEPTGLGDRGGASRFFYQPKVKSDEREVGLYGITHCVKCNRLESREHPGKRPGSMIRCQRNPHPTLKPVDLNRWAATLLLPPKAYAPRRILVPFAGVGSEVIGAMMAGWDEVLGIEMNPKYVTIAQHRIRHWEKHGRTVESNGATKTRTHAPEADSKQTEMF